MYAIWALMRVRFEQLDDKGPASLLALRYGLQQLNLILSRLHVMRGRLLNLERTNLLWVFNLASEPHCRKMT